MVTLYQSTGCDISEGYNLQHKLCEYMIFRSTVLSHKYIHLVVKVA